MAKTGTTIPGAADSGFSAAALTQEFGASGLRQYSGYVREEWLRALIGRKGMLVLREMRDNDAIINAVFTAIEMLLRPVPFRVEPDNEKNKDDQNAADFVQSCFGDMEHSWPDFMADALSFLQYGFALYEIVYKFRRGPDEQDGKFKSQYTDGLVGWRKFAGRAQETMLHWVFDNNGVAQAMIQLLPTGGPLLNVPLSKCLHFRTTPYKQNPEGRSIMRSQYESYFLKKKIQQTEAIGVSRDLTGLLTVMVPPAWMKDDASENDKLALANIKSMVNLVAQNEQAGLVLPMIYDADGHELFKVSLLATGGRRQFATTEIINRYDHAMTASALADFITLGQQSSRGGMGGHGSQSNSKSDMFSTAVIAYLDIIASQMERKAVPDLLQLNAMKGKVKVTHGDIARRDLSELGTYILDLAQAGTLIPDASLEAHVREEGGLPAPDNPDGVPEKQELDQQNQQEALDAKANQQPFGGAPGGKPAATGNGRPGGTGKPAGGDVTKRKSRRI